MTTIRTISTDNTLTDDQILDLDLHAMSDEELRDWIASDASDFTVYGGMKDGYQIDRKKKTIMIRWSSHCIRCCGAGGSSAWPGWTCFRCGNNSPKTHESSKWNLTLNLRKAQECIKNERAGKGRLTNLALKKQAEWKAECEARHAKVAAQGINVEQFHAARNLVASWGNETTYENVEQDEADRAAKAEATEVIEGRQELTGVLFWSKEYINDYGATTKIGVKADNGAVYFGTKPSGSYGSVKGDTVTFTATFTKTGPGKGKYSRPVKASYTANTEEGAANA
jgi:hypothetical protein